MLLERSKIFRFRSKLTCQLRFYWRSLSLVHVLKEAELEIFDITKYFKGFIPNRSKEISYNKDDKE